MKLRILAAGTILLSASPALAELQPPAPNGSVYETLPVLDFSLIGVTSVGILWSNLNGANLTHPRCPCDLGEVNSFDRSALGNSSYLSTVLSDVTVFSAMLVPPLLDGLDFGWSRAWVEDMTVFAEVLSVSGAVVEIAKFTSQRPNQRTYTQVEFQNLPEGLIIPWLHERKGRNESVMIAPTHDLGVQVSFVTQI